MVARHFFALICVLLLSGCAVFTSPEVTKIALLSSFEGRYREIGYDALYAARLAIADSERDNLNLLAIEDGGSIKTAIARAEAIALDPSIDIVMVLGEYATDSEVLEALDKPVIIVGHWNSAPINEAIMLASSDIDTAIQENDANGSEAFALKQTPILQNTENITLSSSATFPDDNFTERYLASDLFVPESAIYTTLVYDATAIAIQYIATGIPLREIEYEGINGAFTFDEAGYWANAPLYRYSYDESGKLILLQ